MKRTGIFFAYFQGERLRDFPGALEGLLDKQNVSYYDAVYGSRNGLFYLEPAAERLLPQGPFSEYDRISEAHRRV